MDILKNESLFPFDSEENYGEGATLEELFERYVFATEQVDEDDEDKPHDEDFYSVSGIVDDLRAHQYYDAMLAYLKDEGGRIVYENRECVELVVDGKAGEWEMTYTAMIKARDRTCHLVGKLDVCCPRNRQEMLFWYLAQLNLTMRYGRYAVRENGEVFLVSTIAIGEAPFDGTVFGQCLWEAMTKPVTHRDEIQSLCVDKLSDEMRTTITQVVYQLQKALEQESDS